MNKLIMKNVILSTLLFTLLFSCTTKNKNNSESSGSNAETVKVGVLHSLSGTMAISETDCKNASLLAIEEINASGGVLGKQIEAVVEDGASDWPTFTEKATKLIDGDGVKSVFGCWTSSSRKAVLPVFESRNNLLFYPVQYEGMEASKNVIYTGAAPNQQILPAVDYMIAEGKKKFFLVGSDYVFPRTANKIIKAKLKLEGYEIVGEEYAPLGHTDFTSVVQKIKSSGADAVLNTINGDSNIGFFKQMKSNGLVSPEVTCMSFSIAEVELKSIGVDIMKDQLTAWNYFMSFKSPENEKFIKAYQAKYGANKVTDDPIEAAYFGVYLWAAAVRKANSFEPADVQKAIGGVSFDAPEGTVSIDPVTNHTIKNFMVGKANEKGQFDIMYKSPSMIKADPFPSIATDKKVIAPGNIQ